MKITVKKLDGSSYELDVQPNYSIKEVKQVIQSAHDIPTYLQQIMFKNKKLKNNEKLDKLGIDNDAVLYLNEVPATGIKIAAGGFGAGKNENQFSFPYGFVLDNQETAIIADWGNHRIMEWKKGATGGTMLIGREKPKENKVPLKGPTDVAYDRRTNSVIICDRGNRRVVSWPRDGNPAEVTVLIGNIACWGVTIDQQGNLYVSDTETHTVKRYPFPPGNHPGDIVAGSRDHGQGMQLDQLNQPSYIFVDEKQNVYVTDTWNHRVMKWGKDAKIGLVAARGFIRGLFVDRHETVYVADYGKQKIMRWRNGENEGNTIDVRHMEGDEEDELYAPWSICWDGQNQMYVADHKNQRIQCFPLT